MVCFKTAIKFPCCGMFPLKQGHILEFLLFLTDNITCKQLLHLEIYYSYLYLFALFLFKFKFQTVLLSYIFTLLLLFLFSQIARAQSVVVFVQSF